MWYDAYKARFGPREARQEYVSMRHKLRIPCLARLMYIVALTLLLPNRHLALQALRHLKARRQTTRSCDLAIVCVAKHCAFVDRSSSSCRPISCKGGPRPSQRVRWEARRHPLRSRVPWPQCLGRRLEDTGHWA